MTMLNTLPTVEEMIAALASPLSPESTEVQEEQMEMSTDDMIKMIFQAVMQPPAAS